MKIFYDPICLNYHQPGHPESPERVRIIRDLLSDNGSTFLKPEPCTDSELLRVHTEKLVVAVQAGAFFDLDTPALPGIADIAMLSAGAAIMCAETAFKGESAFSLMRPPGHHAKRNRVMGFCYFNNMGVAVASFLSDHTGKKAAILDIDVHHGNGTEDIFMGNRSVLFISLHQSPLYPGTGLKSRDNCLNFPMPPGTGEIQYMDVLDKACREIENYKPDLLGISAGFDTFKGDPISLFGLDTDSYKKIGCRIRDLNLPTFIILEGGYSPGLPRCVDAFLHGMEPIQS